MNTVIIRRTFAAKRESIEQRNVTVADLSILVDRLREQLKDAKDRKQEYAILSELRLARLALKHARERAAA